MPIFRMQRSSLDDDWLSSTGSHDLLNKTLHNVNEESFVNVRDVKLHFRKTSSPLQRLKSFYDQFRHSKNSNDVSKLSNQSEKRYMSDHNTPKNSESNPIYDDNYFNPSITHQSDLRFDNDVINDETSDVTVVGCVSGQIEHDIDEEFYKGLLRHENREQRQHQKDKEPGEKRNNRRKHRTKRRKMKSKSIGT